MPEALSPRAGRFYVAAAALLWSTGGLAIKIVPLDALGVAARVHRLGIPDRFVPHATQAEQREEIGIDEEGLLRAFRTGTAGAGVVPIRARVAG